MRRRRPLVAALLVLGVLVLAGWPMIRASIERNAAQVALTRAWLGARYPGPPLGDDLNDGVPDGWSSGNWGTSRSVRALDSSHPYEGSKAYRLMKTDPGGDGPVLVQVLPSLPSSPIRCEAATRGGPSVLGIRDGASQTVAWTTSAGTADWQKLSVDLDGAMVRPPVMLYLQVITPTEPVWFDGVTCQPSGASSSANLLVNSGFEHDGLAEVEAVEWWGSLQLSPGVSGETISAASRTLEEMPGSASRVRMLDVSDLMLGRYQRIFERHPATSTSCLDDGTTPAWLAMQADRWAPSGGLALRERLYRLGIALIPGCSSSYADLARLYAERGGADRSVELYHAAAVLGGTSPFAGRYWFGEGYLRATWTGERELAVAALAEAARRTRWQSGAWLAGALPSYLETFDDAGDPAHWQPGPLEAPVAPGGH